MVEAVDVLRAGLSAVGLDELAASLSTAFWSMRRADQSAVLTEAAAELRRVALASSPEHASAPGVSPDLRSPEGFHYFFEPPEGVVGTDRRLVVEFENEYIGADRPLLDGFADARHWLLNGLTTEATQGLASMAEDVQRLPKRPFDDDQDPTWRPDGGEGK